MDNFGDPIHALTTYMYKIHKNTDEYLVGGFFCGFTLL